MIEDVGESEFFAPFIRVAVDEACALVFYDDEDDADHDASMKLAEKIELVMKLSCTCEGFIPDSDCPRELFDQIAQKMKGSS